jgi:hypothetical protein
MKALLAACVLCGLLVFAGCSNYADMLQRGQVYYEHNEYERALSVWRQLDADRDSLGAEGRVRYYYLRGMTDFRLGYHPDARYWLGLAQASRSGARDALDVDEGKRLDETLAGLSKEVFGLAGKQEKTDEHVLGEKCAWTSECESGFVCEDGFCVQTEAAASADEPPDAAPAPSESSAP